MTILVTSDLQFSANPRDDYRFGIGRVIKDLIEQHDVEWLYILGDLTEAKDEHPAVLVNRVTNLMIKWSNCCKVLVLQGNHDYSDINYPFFEFVRHFPGVKWIKEPAVFHDALFLPHTRDYSHDWVGLDLGRRIFAHNIFAGTTANGIRLDGIPLSLFSDKTTVISGDVHEPQQYDVVTYVGSPYLCDFGDDYQPRVLLLSDDHRIRKSISLFGPQKRLIECAVGKGLLNGWKADKGDIIKVRVAMEPKHVERWDAIRGRIIDWSAQNGYILHTVEPVVDYVPGAIGANRFTHKTDEQYVREYCARRGLDEIMTKAGLAMLE